MGTRTYTEVPVIMKAMDFETVRLDLIIILLGINVSKFQHTHGHNMNTKAHALTRAFNRN